MVDSMYAGKKSRNSVVIIAAIVSPVVSILLLTLLVLWIIFEKKRRKFNPVPVPEESGMAKKLTVSYLLLSSLLCSIFESANIFYSAVEISRVEFLQFDFDTIVAATNNFRDYNKLGEGGFGEVYKVL